MKKSINKVEVSRRTGIRKVQSNSNACSKIRENKLYLIALAVDAESGIVFNEVCR